VLIDEMFTTANKYADAEEVDCHGVRIATCIVVRVGVYGSSVAQVDSRIQESRREDVTVYLSSGQFGPYVQQLMILILKSTQNREVTIECKGRRGLVRG
jgi:hypothetical protein